MASARALTCSLIVAALLTAAHPRDTLAQGTFAQPELRVDAIGPGRYAWQPGAGFTLGFGYYARVSGVVGYAPSADPRFLDDRWRGDVIARVLLDPFRQQRWGLSIGGGLSVRRQTYLVVVIDAEGPEAGGVLPALEIGAGGGLRAGFILRRAVRERR